MVHDCLNRMHTHLTALGPHLEHMPEVSEGIRVMQQAMGQHAMGLPTGAGAAGGQHGAGAPHGGEEGAYGAGHGEEGAYGEGGEEGAYGGGGEGEEQY